MARGTFTSESLFGGGQVSTNPPTGTSKETVPAGPASDRSAISNLPGVSLASGMPMPMLIAMGVLAWWLFKQY